jgi:hypothetical protein
MRSLSSARRMGGTPPRPRHSFRGCPAIGGRWEAAPVPAVSLQWLLEGGVHEPRVANVSAGKPRHVPGDTVVDRSAEVLLVGLLGIVEFPGRLWRETCDDYCVMMFGWGIVLILLIVLLVLMLARLR